jgi:hypothetical protein
MIILGAGYSGGRVYPQITDNGVDVTIDTTASHGKIIINSGGMVDIESHAGGEILVLSDGDLTLDADSGISVETGSGDINLLNNDHGNTLFLGGNGDTKLTSENGNDLIIESNGNMEITANGDLKLQPSANLEISGDVGTTLASLDLAKLTSGGTQGYAELKKGLIIDYSQPT